MKILVRLCPVFLGVLVFLLKESISFHDLLLFIFIIINMILTYSINIPKLNSILNYSSWIVFTLIVVFLRSIELDNSLIILLILKIGLLIINHIKFNNISVPATFLSRVWIFSISLYLSELVLNSTHITKEFCLILGILSSLESIVIILALKSWQQNVISIYTILKRE